MKPYRGPRGELARSFAIRFDEDLVTEGGGRGAIVIGVEATAGRWYEVPLDHDQAIEFVDELSKLVPRYVTAQ
jgi:hypothetical protein